MGQLILKDNSKYEGRSFGGVINSIGEVVFNTSMVGYVENLTDPSYKGQILVLTYPIIGNYGVPKNHKSNSISNVFESSKIQVSGLIISYESITYSHPTAILSLGEWLKQEGIPALSGIDTRCLVKHLRKKGSMIGKIEIDSNLKTLNQKHKIAKNKLLKVYGSGKYKILLIGQDYKYNILRSLLIRNSMVINVSFDYDFNILDYDAIVVANGPGNPNEYKETISNIKKNLIQKRPILAICLGCQLLGLASGAKVYKLKYGHRGHNQPVINIDTKKAYMTSQNHGFAIDHNTLPSDWKTLYLNLNDDTCEGIKHAKLPFIGVQFHPESSGGPLDTNFVFDDFFRLIATYKNNEKT